MVEKSAVERFLTRLETETMIKREAGHGKLVITICNYDKYQSLDGSGRDSLDEATETAAGQQRDTKEQRNQVTNVIPIGITERVFDAWNAMADATGEGGLSSARKLTDARKKKINARIKDFDVDTICAAIARIPESPFLMGENDRGWRADFDFALRPGSMTKLIEGAYHNRGKANGKKSGWLDD